MPKSKANFYYDGFNFYHGICDISRRDLLWLDLVKFSRSMLLKTEKLNRIRYFTTLPLIQMGGIGKIIRHEQWLKVFDTFSFPIKVHKGKFKRITHTCKAKCKMKFEGFSEKRTDVNISVQLIGDAIKDNYDVAYIVSGDTDFLPAIEFVKSEFPNKQIKVLCPPGRISKTLRDRADFTIYLKPGHLEKHVLPDEILREGRSPLKKPSSWKK